MGELIVSPVVASDDGYINRADSGYRYSTGAIQFGVITYKRMAWFRFPDITIAKDSVISSAVLRVQSTNNFSTSCTVKIYCNDVDDAVVPATYADVNALVKTTAYKEWAAPSFITDGDYDVDVADPVQEIVNRSGWSSGNALMLLIDTDESGTHYREVKEQSVVAAILTITFVTGEYEATVEETIAFSSVLGEKHDDVIEEALNAAELISEKYPISVLDGLNLLEGMYGGKLYVIDTESIFAVVDTDGVVYACSVEETLNFEAVLDQIKAEMLAESLTFVDVSRYVFYVVTEESLFAYSLTEVGWQKTVLDMFDIADVSLKILSILVSEWLTKIDSAVPGWHGVEIVPDALSLNSFITDGKLYAKLVEDGFDAVDIAQIRLGVLALTHLLISVSATSTLSAGSLSTTLADGLTITDLIQYALLDILAEALTLTDVNDRSYHAMTLLLEQLGLTDLVVILRDLLASIDDTMSTTDVTEVVHTIHKLIEDTIAAEDATIWNLTLVILEAMGFSSLATAIRSSVLISNDLLTLNAQPSYDFPLVIAEVLSIIDAQDIIRLFVHTIAESLGGTDAVNIVKKAYPSVTDPITLVSVILSKQTMYTVVQETLPLHVIIELNAEVWECYALNTPKFMPSMYSGFNFNSYCVFGNRAFGADESVGIYELTGTTDAGAPIRTGVVFSPTDFGLPNQKRFRRGYLGLSGTSPVMVLETEDGTREAYAIDSQGKVVTSSDLKSKVWKLSVADFDTLNHLKLIPVILTR